ncbi:MAG: PIN domain-containing protein [Thermoproteales archaeon]|nr:PIN domain-containing protein [Thermoproteales archaeon]RLE66546.1 MAG: hypothetical protein DRJ47_02420 [Thermoprotei archaeon]
MGTRVLGASKAWALGVVDVGLIVLSHCENPAKNEAIDFLEKIFLGEINAKIPVTGFIGAYHILTRYLKVEKEQAKTELLKTLELRHPSLISDVSVDHAITALKNAVRFKVEGWDGYLISLADSLGASIIYTIDRKLARVKHLSIVIPISRRTLQEYYQWIEEKLKDRCHTKI